MTGDAKKDQSPLLSRWLSTAPRDEKPAKPRERVDAQVVIAEPAPKRSGEVERSVSTEPGETEPSVEIGASAEELLAALRARVVSALPPFEARVLDELLAPIVAASLPSSDGDPDELVARFEQVEDVLAAYLLRASGSATQPTEEG